MTKYGQIAFLLLLPLLFLGQLRALKGGPSPAAGQDADKLVTLLRENSFREADRLATALLKNPDLDMPTMAVCGLAILKAGRIEEAEALFKRVISRSPGNPEANLGLGRIDRIRNDADAAIVHFRKAVPSKEFYGEALRWMWRTAWDRGLVDDLLEIYKLAEGLYDRESKPLPSWFSNGLTQVKGLAGKRLFKMEGSFERLRVPLIGHENQRVRMISLKLNGKGDYPFHLDSASADFLTLSPVLADDLGLPLTGNSTASGVGTGTAAVRFSVLDRVDLGAVTFRNVPVMVSDIHTLRGLKTGLLGTALLKRFNVTIDVEAGVMDFYPLDRPEFLTADIDRTAVAADLPLYIYDATTVEASMAGAPLALYILDTAAGTNLVDGPFFMEHIKPRLDPDRITRFIIRGATGSQPVNRITGLQIGLGSLVFDGQTVCEFPMKILNEIGGRYCAGLLGNPLLWTYRVHMDFQSGRLILENIHN